MSHSQYCGLLFIGDPHLEGRQPGFRKDDYPAVILQKLEWSLHYAQENGLLPILLGDLFDKPRDNPTWLIGRLIELLQGEVLTIYGNHDVHYQPELTDHDSLSLLVKSGRLQLIDEATPWVGTINDRTVVVGGSSYRQEIPKKYDSSQFGQSGDEPPLVVWITHHDILIPGYDEGRIQPKEITGIDVVINGHIHRRLETINKGATSWITPGNISRRSRSDASREHVPAVLEMDVSKIGWEVRHVEIPHEKFEDVFHDVVIELAEQASSSAFVAGLSELQARKTNSGAGLMEFLKQNVDQFEPKVTDQIWKLAEEVTNE